MFYFVFMDMQQNPSPIAQPLPAIPQAEPILPKRRNKRLLYGGITLGVIALVSATVALTMLLTNNANTPNSTNNKDTVSYTVQDTETTLPSTEDQDSLNEELSFDIDLSSWGSNRSVNVKLMVQEGTSLKKEVKSHELGYTLTNGANSMYVFLPYESFPVPYSSFERVGTNVQFGTISRFTIDEEVYADTVFYTSNENLNGICTEGMYNYTTPCGERFIGTANAESIFVSCPTSSKEFCDSAVLTMSVKTSPSAATKDLSLEIDFSDWMNYTIKTLELSNVPASASATLVSEQNNRVKGYRIQNEDFSLFLHYPYEGISGQVSSKEGNLNNVQFGEVLRVVFKDELDKTYYVGTEGFFNCEDVIHVEGWTGECSVRSLNESSNPQTEHVFAICERGFDYCDSLVESLKVSTREI